MKAPPAPAETPALDLDWDWAKVMNWKQTNVKPRAEWLEFAAKQRERDEIGVTK